MKITTVKTSLFKENQDLFGFITTHLPRLAEKSILVITSKIVALFQGRTVDPRDISWDELIKQESQWAVLTKYCYLTLKEGMIAPNAGIDKSNADGKWILWPRDSYGEAKDLRQRLRRHYKIKKLGVLITDSRVLPLRKGITGVALGYAGFKGLRNYIGKGDIFGRKLKMSRTNVADSLAAAAVLLMGEADEQTPLAVIEDAPVEFVSKQNKRELRINPAADLYRPLFEKFL
ncbi:MAG: coenzyme F420-0:L-glutamate ligase [Candidatus Magasanikbacteria bacterium]|nr:coenzyme F420-0:L-glutamate ligase [Candidatus Magasanikbacteria bacterium]